MTRAPAGRREAALVVCADAASYIRQADAARQRPGPVPVIGYPEVTRRLAAMTAAGAASGGRPGHSASSAGTDGEFPDRHRVVAVIGSNPVTLAAGALFAADRGRDLVPLANWDELATMAERAVNMSITVISELSGEPSAMDAVLRLPPAGCAGNVSIGLLIGRDEAQLTWTVAKQLMDEGGAGDERILLYPERASDDSSWANRRVLSGRGVEAFIGESVSRPATAFLAITSSGRPDYISTGRGVICGARMTINPHQAGGRPPCAHGLGCVKPGPRVPASALQTDVLMLKSCQSGHLGSSIYAPDFLLALSALDGPARSVVATVRAPGTAGWEAELFEASLRAGLSHGTSVLLLNAAVREALTDEPSYILLGDPEARGPAIGERAVRILDDRPGAGGPGQMVTGPGISGYARIRIGDRQGLVAWSTAEAGLGADLDVSAHEGERAEMAVARARRTQRNLAGHLLGGLIPVFSRDLAADARRAAHQTALLLARADSDPAAASALGTAVSGLEQTLDQVDVATASLLAGDRTRVPFPFLANHEEHYRSTGPPRHDGRCWCGAALMQQDVRPLDDPAATRMKWSCFRCGLVALCGREPLPVRWSGPSRCVGSGRIRHRFEIGPSNRPLTGVIKLEHPWIGQGQATFEPGWSRFAVASSPVTVEIDEVMHDVAPNVYPTRAYVVYEGEIDHYRKAIEVAGGVAAALPNRHHAVAPPA